MRKEMNWLEAMRTSYLVHEYGQPEKPLPGKLLTLDLISEDYEAVHRQIIKTLGNVDYETSRAVMALEQYLDDLRDAQKSGQQDQIIECACQVGACWMSLRERIDSGKAIITHGEKPKPGKRENAVWAYARNIYAKSPKEKVSHICAAARESYRKATGKACKISLKSMESAFAKRVKGSEKIVHFYPHFE